MSVRSQTFPPSPTFTETSLPSLSSRVYVITGATSGVGLELAKILYSKGAAVYIAARNAARITSAIGTIKGLFPESTGRLEPLEVDLSDLKSIAPAARLFKAKETRLDGLVLNAGVMMAPEGSKTQQGHDLQIGTNCLGGYLLSRQLEHVLINTVGIAEMDSVRVVWLASTLQNSNVITWDDSKNEPKLEKGPFENYMMTKGGNVLLAHETSTRLGSHGVLSVSVNPGLMKTELQRHMPKPASFVMGLLFKSAKFGAYSELFGLLSPEITFEKNGTYIIPWGRFGCLPEDFKTGLKKADQGGTGTSARFVDWCERETKAYM
ncbi:short-chain alcohol dehydrogenase [Neonectria punicea]|uniref:Short-chain alcohol dehydrogenase n=1 Tax=Neonectria punicea TaxID=979145 RepID=A0ABR1H794_9HYPO